MSGAVAVCVKWVDLNPMIDPLHGTVVAGRHGWGLSDADRAAVEVALRIGEAWDVPVEAVCVGPRDAEDMLRELTAAGVARATRLEVTGHEAEPPSSAEIARLVASAWASAADGDATPDVVVCGDASLDRGSGSVPAFLAHELGAAQALGLVEVDAGGPGELRALRRLDGGRRERLRVPTPAVLSVEGSVATLRRGPLSATLAARSEPIRVVPVRVAVTGDAARLRPWRPRPRALPGPAGDRALDRIVALTGALVDRTPPRTVTAEPAVAAETILDQLRTWGYLPQDP